MSKKSGDPDKWYEFGLKFFLGLDTDGLRGTIDKDIFNTYFDPIICTISDLLPVLNIKNR